MAEVDTSIYKLPPPQNPLQTLLQIGSLGSQINQNKLFQQQYESNIAIGKAIKEATDPNTGQVDTARLGSRIAADPKASWNMLPTMTQAQGLKTATTQAEASQFELASKNLGMMKQTLGALVSDPEVTPAKVIQATGKLINSGVLTPKIAAAQLAQMPTDPAALRNWLTGHLMTTMDAQQRMAQTQTGVTPQGVPVMGTQEQFARGAINSQPLPGQPQRAPVAPQMGQRPPVAPGVRPPMPAGVTAPVGAPAPAMPVPAIPAPPAQPPGIVMGVPAGTKEAQAITGQAGAQQGIALEKAADAAPARQGMLANLEKNLGSFESGPMAERARTLKAGVNQVGSVIGVKPFDEKNLAAQESFVKEATMLAQQQFQALGGTGTDQQLGSAFKSNPNEALSKEGNKNILAMLKGNEAALVAKNDAWQKWKAKNGPDTYAQFSSDFNRSYSPRAFQWVFLTTEDRAKMVKSMNANERKALAGALQDAESRGWIKPDGAK